MMATVYILIILILLGIAIAIQYSEIKERDEARNEVKNFLYFVSHCSVTKQNDKVIENKLKRFRASNYFESDNIYLNTIDTINKVYMNRFYPEVDSWISTLFCCPDDENS